ncbi:HAMP domain-containing histidine kinase [Patescibacteria group bacterium]|nr:HAMP domain-containing histidine kinase [Patescibacteria group bacterium]
MTKRLFVIRVVLTQMLVGIISVLLFINLVLSRTAFEYFWKGGLLIAFLAAGYLFVKSVINEIKQRQELERAHVKLKELDEAKSEFVSIASHQLRTPLTAIKGYISMLMEGSYGKLSSKQKKPITNIYDSNERLIRLVNDLLNISRIESGRIKMEPQKAKLQEVLQGVVDELKIKAKQKNLKLVLRKPKLPLPSFNLDPAKMRNVVLNIIDNAIRYTAKGSITLRLTPQPENRNLQTKSVLITIKDTGEGMSKEELQHLFESFTRGKTGTKMWTEGAGLGLYIAKQFVQMHKGKIWAKSPGKGKGSTFFIELPV